ncbi:unnamed protein product [Phytophthora fragariaefolia]|uniref:Unnamed protein product n=1 Tax=Phytophthora fragariaefolia TaxID=1490495 RepID=A0A9W6XIE2_9STRA|nr:unnamed protein product [Phytophthora fragariaefolia]
MEGATKQCCCTDPKATNIEEERGGACVDHQPSNGEEPSEGEESNDSEDPSEGEEPNDFEEPSDSGEAKNGEGGSIDGGKPSVSNGVGLSDGGGPSGGRCPSGGGPRATERSPAEGHVTGGVSVAKTNKAPGKKISRWPMHQDKRNAVVPPVCASLQPSIVGEVVAGIVTRVATDETATLNDLM